MSRQRTIRLALIGGGMFGGDVILRSIEDLERCGIAPYLGRIGLDPRARDLADAEFRLEAIATRTQESAKRLVASYRGRVPGAAPTPLWGERPWEELFATRQIDLLFVATPDHLHYEPTRHAIDHGACVLVEKPLTLSLSEARKLIDRAREKGVVVGVDMHKRYDPCHRFLFADLVPRIGAPLYARAILEEPLRVSTEIFRWAADSDPFSYVGVHWLDLFSHYLGARPASLHAVGQKRLLADWSKEGGDRDIDTFDAMQVAVDYDSGLRVYYVNNWIVPEDFEGPVDQEMEIVGTRGKIWFDQQDRGLRATITGGGTRTFNPHFTSDVNRPGGGPPAYDGYGKDSVVAIAACAAEVILGHAGADELADRYPTAASTLSSVAIIEAAREVALRNLECLRRGNGTPVTARFDADLDWTIRGA